MLLFTQNKFAFSAFLSKKLKNKIYKTIIFLVVSYSCETRSLKLREERRLRRFENKILRQISGPTSDQFVPFV